MDIISAALVSLIQAVLGFAGVIVSLRKRSERARVRFAICFGALSLVGIAVVVWQAVLASRSNEENRRTLLGDPERPPFVSVISLPGTTWFVTVNNSDYPAYGTKIQLFDDANKATVARSYDHPDMAAHVAIRDDKPWTPSDDAAEHHFTAQIATRTGLVYEELILRKAGNNQWMKASRVLQGMQTLEQDIDSSWPRDQDGQVNWN